MKHKQHAQIGMWIDSYDNLFSDFDSSHYSTRQISSDFFDEAKKIIQEINPQKFALNLIIPKNKRKYRVEKIIIHRLHQIFNTYRHKVEKSLVNQRKKGFLILILGFISMLSAATLNYFNISNFPAVMLTTILEPAGWYCVWYSMDSLIYSTVNTKKDLIFYQKLASAEIIFHNE